MTTGRPPVTLAERCEALRRDALEEFERTGFCDNFWLTYTLLGWTNLAACAVSHYLVEVVQWQEYWPYFVVWVVQILVALAAIRLGGNSLQADHLPLLAFVNRVDLIFLLLCWNVALLNVMLGLPVFTLLPLLATLSSFLLLVFSLTLSRKLVLAALTMFATGTLIAQFPHVGFLLYGFGWLLVLQTLGVIFYRKRQRWLDPVITSKRLVKGQDDHRTAGRSDSWALANHSAPRARS